MADHLIESINAACHLQWEESLFGMNSSFKPKELGICLFGASQQFPKKNQPRVRAKSVAAHLVQVAETFIDKTFERHIGE